MQGSSDGSKLPSQMWCQDQCFRRAYWFCGRCWHFFCFCSLLLFL